MRSGWLGGGGCAELAGAFSLGSFALDFLAQVPQRSGGFGGCFYSPPPHPTTFSSLVTCFNVSAEMLIFLGLNKVVALAPKLKGRL